MPYVRWKTCTPLSNFGSSFVDVMDIENVGVPSFILLFYLNLNVKKKQILWVNNLDFLQYDGSWWLPEFPGRKISGKLNYKFGESATLSIDGIFGEKDKHEFYQVILGDCKGNEITLVGCFRTHYNISTKLTKERREYKQSEFHVLYMFKGFHFAKREDIQFSRIKIKYSHLRDWLGEKVFDFSKEEETEEEYVLKVKKPPTNEISLKNLNVSIIGAVSFDTGPFDDSYERTALIRVDTTEKTHFENLFRIIYHLKNFLSLVTGEAISILSITGEIPEKTDELPEQIEIYNSQTIGENNSKNYFTYTPTPVEYKDISDRMQFYLNNWFEIINNFEPTYELYFRTMNTKSSIISEFLSLSQAIEAYTSRTSKNGIIDKDLFEQHALKLKEIIKNLPVESQPEFENKIKFMNRKSLRRMTKELCQSQKYNILFKVFIENEQEFIGKFVDTRNYYTHYDLEAKGRIDVSELIFLTEKLRFMVRTILLRELGFEDKYLERIIKIYSLGRIDAIYR